MSPMSADEVKAIAVPFQPDSWAGRLVGRAFLSVCQPRFRDWHFWLIQSLVAAVAATHVAIEALRLVGRVPGDVNSLFFVPATLFLVPVVYAALYFGSSGSLPTAAWCIIVTLPNLVWFHDGTERWGELFQLGLLVATAMLVGRRVDREMAAWGRAEAADLALRASEARYRRLFEYSPAAVLVLDGLGTVLDANPAAGALFGRTPASLTGIVLSDLVGSECAQRVLVAAQRDQPCDGDLILKPNEDTEVHLEPMCSRISDSSGAPIIQLLLRDATSERQRQAGLRAYAASVLRAQEEERKRIAQELHDEAVQRMVLLCRQLDLIESHAESLPAPVVASLVDVRRLAEQVVADLRGFARALRPPMLDDLGLVACVRRLLTDLAERTRLDAQLHVVGAERRLRPDAELGLFRIAQEALWNVQRHACASQVSVTITFAEHGVGLEVADDGLGFALPPGTDFAASGQLGLLGMRERAEALGGSLVVQARPGEGTRVSVRIP